MTNHWVSLPAEDVEAGTATAGNQLIEIALLTSIDSKLTSPLAVTGNWLTDAQLRASPVTITGTVVVTQGTSPWVISGTVAATQSGSWTTGRTWTLSSGTDSVASVQSGTWNINNISGTISLPTGASTSANQLTEIASLASIDSKLTAPLSVTGNWLTDAQLRATPVPISGTVTALQGTSPWVVSGSVTTSPDVNVHDGTGVSISSTGSSLNVNVTNTVPVTGTFFQAVQPVSQSGTWNINNISGTISLPTGAATAANQATEIASLASIDSKLTSPLAVTGNWLTDAQLRASPVPVLSAQSGAWSVNVNNGAGASAVNIQDGGNSITVDGVFFQAVQPVSQSGTWTTGRTWTLASGTDSVASVQSGAWSVNVNNAAGASAVNIQDGGNSITVDGTIAATQSGTWNINNISGTISLPTGASTAANQTTEIASLASIDTKLSELASDTATLTQIANTASSTTVLSANAARKGCLFTNTSNKICYVSYKSTSTTTNFSFRLVSDDFYEMKLPVYRGVISVIWGSAGSGNLNVTELT